MRSFLVFGVIATLGCSSPNTPGTGSAGVVEPAPAAKAVSVCTYPEAPYGKAVGQTIPPTLTWSGYMPARRPIQRWPRIVSTSESAASTPTSMRTNRKSIMIAPVYTTTWTTPRNGASCAT